MTLFLGIDGGQSSTTVLIGDGDGNVLGRGRGGPCNHVSTSEAAAKFTRVIRECLAEACVAAGLGPATVHFKSACCGMSGGPADKTNLLSKLLRADHLKVVTDGEIALAGAMNGGPGAIVIAGTGSIAYARNSSGTLARAGGWGYIFGDEGGAFHIAREAIRASTRYEEGWGPPTALRAALLAATNGASMNELLHACYTPDWPRSRVATLSALVDSLANNGDPIARSILEQSAQHLASLAGAVRAQLFSPGEPVDIAYIGGVFQSLAVLHRFRLLIELSDNCHCIAPIHEPAMGALLEARRAC